MYSEVAAYELRFYKKELRKRSMIRIVLKKSVKSPINLKIQVHIYIYTCVIIKDLSIYIYMYIERRRQWHPTPVLLPENPMDRGAWQAAVPGVAKSRTRLSDFTLTFHFHALEKEMATHSSVLDWRIPGTGEPGGLPAMGSH